MNILETLAVLARHMSCSKFVMNKSERSAFQQSMAQTSELGCRRQSNHGRKGFCGAVSATVGLLWILALISVRGLGGESISLAWDANKESNLAGYRIYYGALGLRVSSSVDNGNKTTIRLTDLRNAATYYFFATAYSTDSQESELSNLVYWTFPTVAGGLGLDGAVGLWWEPGSEGVEYVVKRSVFTDGPYVSIATNSVPHWVDTNVSNGILYSYRIVLRTSRGDSPESARVVVTPRAAPGELTASGGTNRVILVWSPMAGALDYTLVRAEVSEGPYRVIAERINGNGYSDTDVREGREYFYRVSARSEGETLSGYSKEAAATTAPSVPLNVSGSLFAGGVARVEWSFEDQIVDGFVVEHSADGVRFENSQKVSSKARAAILTGFSGGTTRFFRVYATNAAGRSVSSPAGRVDFPALAANVNFDLETAAGDIPGYLQDFGALYGEKPGGSRYGWAVDQRESGARRGSPLSQDTRYDSSMRFDPSSVWEMELPRGSYFVRIVAGDPDDFSGTHQFLIEGLPTTVESPTTDSRWVEFTKRLFVEDGRLTLSAGPASARSRICFVDVYAVAPELPVFENQPLSQVIDEEETLRLEASVAGGTEPLFWQWYLNSMPLPGANAPALEIPRIQPGQAGNYFAVAGNAFGGSTSSVAVVVVNAIDDPPTLDPLPSFILPSSGETRDLPLTGITSGAVDESQPIQVSVTNRHPSLLSRVAMNYVSPQTSGNLSVTPVPGARGAAVVTVLVDDGGRTHGPVARSFTVTLVGNVKEPLSIEAETGQFTPSLTIANDSTASNGQVLRPASTEAGGMVFPFELEEAGNYSIWCRVFSEDATGVSFRAALDREPADAEDAGVPATRLNSWRWARLVRLSNGDPSIVPLNRGLHTLTLKTPRTRFRLDALFLSSDPNFLPSGVTANIPPTLDAMPDLSLRENDGRQVVSITGITSGHPSERQTLQASAVSSDLRIIPHPTVSYVSPASSGTLAFTPVAGAFGTVAVTVTVNDGGAVHNIERRVFIVSVRPIDQAPRLASLSNLTSLKGRAIPPIPWLIGDRETAADKLIVLAKSSNPSLLPSESITISGSGSNRVITLSPIPSRTGLATVTLEVTDSAGLSAIRSFDVTILGSTSLPTLTLIPDAVIDEDSSGRISFVVGDGESSASDLTVSATSSDARLFPATGLVLEADGANRSLVFTPARDQTGEARITLVVRDPSGGASQTSFLVTVRPVNDAPTLAPIPDQTVAVSAPSFVVNLTGITAGGGESQALSLRAISDRPDITPHPLVRYTSPSTRATLTLGPFDRPADNIPIRVIVDDGDPARGTVTQMFHVTITGTVTNRPPTLSSIAEQRVDEDTPITIPFVIGDDATPAYALSVVASASPNTLIPEGGVLLSGLGNARTITLSPFPNQFGMATVNLSVSDGRFTNRASFPLIVRPVNDPPNIDIIPDLAVVGSAANVEHLVTATGINPGPPNETESVTVAATSSNPALIPDPVVRFSPSAQTADLVIRPAPDQVGSAVITVSVTESGPAPLVTRREFHVHVRSAANKPPSISALEDVILGRNVVSGPIAFLVTDSESPPESLTVTASSSNPDLLPDSGITLGGSGTNRTFSIRPVRDRIGFSMVTLSVADPSGGQSSATFFVVVESLNQPPVITGLADRVLTLLNPQLEFEFSVSDFETAAAQLSIKAKSSNESVIPQANVTLWGSGQERLMILRAAPERLGTSIITVSVSDEFITTERSFKVDVVPGNAVPVISELADVSIPEDGALNGIAFTVTDAESPEASIIVTASSSNPTLIPNAGLVLSRTEAGRALEITPALGETGSARVTLKASDGTNEVARSFEVVVADLNNIPTLDPIPPVHVPQNAVSIEVVLRGVGPGVGESGQPVFITASSKNASIIPHPTVGPLQPDGTAILKMAPVPGSTGTVAITVAVGDFQAVRGVLLREFQVVFNAAPVLTRLGSLVLREDEDSGLIPFSVNDPDDPASSLVVSVESSDSSVIRPSDVVLGGSGTERTLRVIPVREAYGLVVLTLVARDLLGNVSRSPFVVSVTPVNDPPTLDPIADLELSGQETWVQVRLDGISSGPGNESALLSLIASSSDPAFMPDPIVSYFSPNRTATLYLAPARTVTGTAEITVTVLDLGDRDQNGSRRFSRTFKAARTTPPPVPELLIVRAEEGWSISWTGDRTAAYVLQTAIQLEPAGGWVSSGVTPSLEDGRYTVRLPSGTETRFFRLCQGCPP